MNDRDSIKEAFLHLCVLQISDKGQAGTIERITIPSERSNFSVRPALSHETVKKVMRMAIGGSIEDMVTVSMFYHLGLGVPQSIRRAYDWTLCATLQAASEPFDVLRKELKKQIKLIDSGELSIHPKLDYFWPSAVLDNTLEVLRKTRLKPVEVPSVKQAIVTPVVSGLDVFVIYKVVSCEFDYAIKPYACYVPALKQFVPVEMLKRIKGMVEGDIDPNIDVLPFETDEPFYVVHGVITTPKRKADLLESNFDLSYTAKPLDLFKLFLCSDGPLKERSVFVHANSDTIRTKRKELNKCSKKKTPNKYKRISAELKELEALEGTTDQAAYQRYVASLPHFYLDFIVNTVFTAVNGKVKVGSIVPPKRSNGGKYKYAMLSNEVPAYKGSISSKTVNKIHDELTGEFNDDYTVNRLFIRDKDSRAVLLKNCKVVSVK